MKAYIVQFHNPQEDDYDMTVLGEAAYEEWMVYARRNKIEEQCQVIKEITFTDEEIARIRVKTVNPEL